MQRALSLGLIGVLILFSVPNFCPPTKTVSKVAATSSCCCHDGPCDCAHSHTSCSMSEHPAQGLSFSSDCGFKPFVATETKSSLPPYLASFLLRSFSQCDDIGRFFDPIINHIFVDLSLIKPPEIFS